MKKQNKLLESVSVIKPPYEDKEWELITEKLIKDFEDFFKKSPYYTGENCSPKYETYRMCWKMYISGFKSMVEIIYEDTYIDDDGNIGISKRSLTKDIVYCDNFFKIF